MKTIKLTIIALALAAFGFGQTILSTTTLGAAITSTTTSTTVTLASTSTMQTSGPVNQINTCLYIDAELFGVATVVDSTHVTVQGRGKGCGAIGLSSRPVTHLSGATVYFANTVTNGTFITPAASLIGKNIQPASQQYPGNSCTASAETALPLIYLFNGVKLDCLASGRWIQVNAPGPPVLGSVYTVPAGTIVPTGNIFLTDTGTAAATSITLPHGWAPGMCITIIPGGAFTWTTAGNIRATGTAVAGKATFFCWDGAKWDANI